VANRGGGGDCGGGAIAAAGGAIEGAGEAEAPAIAGVWRDAEKSACALAPAAIVMTPPHTEQRARTLAPAIFSGSTRNTDRHSGQVTFIAFPRRGPPAGRRRCA
jgi:hypothetical protein